MQTAVSLISMKSGQEEGELFSAAGPARRELVVL